MRPEGGLGATRLLAYGLPGLPLAVLGLPLYVYLPTFYAEDLGLSLAAVGAALLVARASDVVTDPLVGWLSDHGPGRRQRRKRLLWIGLPLLLLAVHALFMPPAGAGLWHLLGWSLLLYLGWTLVVLPYSAWGAELSADYHERSRITAAREGFVILGTLLAAAVPALAGEGDGLSGALALLALAVLAGTPLALLAATLLVPEPARYRPPVPWRRGLALLRENGPFLRLLAAYFLNGCANALPATLFLLFVGHVLQAEAQAGPLLALYFVAGVLSLPLWLRLGRRLGKHRTWSASMIWACLVFAWVPFLGPGDLWAFAAICLLSGLSLGVDMALPASMAADVIDLDRARGGGDRAGLFFGIWGMTTKLALALAVGLAFPLLDLAGFEAGTANPPGALLALALLYAGLPVALKLGALALVWSFPLDEATQRRLVTEPEETPDANPAMAGPTASSAPARGV